MNLFKSLRGAPAPGVVILQCRASEVVATLAATSISPTFISGYVSPHVDIDPVARAVAARFPGVPVMLCSTAGELCGDNESLYCRTGDSWDRVVIQCFDATLVARAQVVAVPLGCEDLRRGQREVSVRERVARIARNIESARVDLDIDHRDTLAYILFDGLSASESFFMEALYDSGRFPCLFVGGSAGGKFDFKNTWIHDGSRRLENHALIAFLKMPRGIRFGVLKSQNFVPDGPHFPVIGASLEQRHVSQVIDAEGRIVPFVDALCAHFRCTPRDLEGKLADYSFAIQVGKEIFVRSVVNVDLSAGRVNFYCDISPGEELLLVRRTSLVQSTEQDFRAFMAGKPGAPVAGILNDCILRRLYNDKELSKVGSALPCKQLAGFSTFGEILGLNLNQTLTAVFFFRVPEGTSFRDDYVDNFVAHYGEFKAFFLRRQSAKLAGLSRVIVKQIADYQSQAFDSQLDPSSFDDNIALVVHGLNSLGQTLRESHDIRDDTARQLESCAGDLYASVGSLTGHIQEQGRVVHAASDTVGELTRQAADAADSARKLAEKSRMSAGEIGADISTLASEIGRVAGEIERQAGDVSNLSGLLSDIEAFSGKTAGTADHTKTVADTLKNLTGNQRVLA